MDDLALGRNNDEYFPEKVVVITGPTLASSLKLVLFGVLMGSASMLYLMRQRDEGSLTLTDQQEKAAHLMQRLSSLARRTKDLAQTVTQTVMPHLQDAVDAAKTTATETEDELQKGIDEAF